MKRNSIFNREEEIYSFKRTITKAEIVTVSFIESVHEQLSNLNKVILFKLAISSIGL